MAHSGRTRVAGIMGWPVMHSRSPRLHGFWLDRHGIDGAYVPLPVRPEDLASGMRALRHFGFAGANVTIPHKESVAALCDALGPTAARAGAVNTIVARDDGTLEGHNSDGFGFVEHLRQSAPGWKADAPAVLLGAGGGARAIAAALADHGVPEVRVVNRSQDRANRLAEDLGPPVTALPWGEWQRAFDGAGLLANCTSLGMSGQPPLEVPLDALPDTAVVDDIVYAPLRTELLARAEARGHATVNGIGMLLHQGRFGFRAWFGVDPEVDDALRDYVLGNAP